MYLVSYYFNGFYQEEILNTKDSKQDRERFKILQGRFKRKNIYDLTIHKLGSQLNLFVCMEG